VVTPRSACAGVSRLPAGHLLVWENGREELRRWYTLPLLDAGERPQLSEAEWAEGLLARLEDAVRIHLRSDVPVGVWLSAGIDSSGVAAIAARMLGRTVDAFSLEFDDPRYDEVGGARTLDRFPGYDLRAPNAPYGRDFGLLSPCGTERVRRRGHLRQLSLAPASWSRSRSPRRRRMFAGTGGTKRTAGCAVSRLVEDWPRERPRTEGRDVPCGSPSLRWGQVRRSGGDRSAGIRRGVTSTRQRRRRRRVSPPLDTPAWRTDTRGVAAVLGHDAMRNYIVHSLDHHSMAWSVECGFLPRPRNGRWCLAMPPRFKQSSRRC
jgi:hypothetical protein